MWAGGADQHREAAWDKAARRQEQGQLTLVLQEQGQLTLVLPRRG
jgi:hypothetical protein